MPPIKYGCKHPYRKLQVNFNIVAGFSKHDYLETIKKEHPFEECPVKKNYHQLLSIQKYRQYVIPLFR